VPLADLSQEDFSAGTFRSVDRRLIPPNGAWDIQNGLLDDDGSVYRRGGIRHFATAFTGGGMLGVWDAIFSAGRRTVFATGSAFGVLAADDVTPVTLGGAGVTGPARAAQVGDLLFIDGGAVYAGSRKTSVYNAGTVTVTQGSTTVTGAGTSWLANVDPGMLFSLGNGRFYVVQSVSSDTVLVLSEPYLEATAPGAVYMLRPIGVADTANARYRVADHYAVAASRLIMGEGRNVWFSDTLDSTTGRPRPYSIPATNYHELPGGAQVIGLATVGTKVLVFTTNGLFVITNMAFDVVDPLGNQQHAVQVLSEDLILWGKGGIAGWQQAVIAPCTNGIYLLDGTSAPVLLSRSITPLLQDHMAQGRQPGSGAVYRNHYLLPILDAAGAVTEMLVCRLDRAANTRLGTVFPWVRWTGYAGELAALATRVGAQGVSRQPILLAGPNVTNPRLADVSSAFTPDLPYQKDADGTAHALSVTTRDFDLNVVPDFVRRMHLRYVLVGLPSDTPAVRAYYSAASARTTTQTSLWDQMLWDQDVWATTEGDDERGLSDPGDAPVSDGTRQWTWNVGADASFIRFRVESQGAPSRLTVRGITTVYRENRRAI
jgi:hypothetical protein